MIDCIVAIVYNCNITMTTSFPGSFLNMTAENEKTLVEVEVEIEVEVEVK